MPVLAAFFALFATATAADPAAMDAFRAHCFSPFLTAETAKDHLDLRGVRYEFYDLDPFSDVAPSPATGRPVAPGTDRRCEVAFDGDHAARAAEVVADALTSEGITTPAPLPARYTADDGTALIGARQLNPRRIAVVEVGTRPNPDTQNTETFMLVERMLPSGRVQP